MPNLPANSQVAVSIALDNKPFLLAAAKESDATRYDIGVARSHRLPRLNAVGGVGYYNYLGSTGVGSAGASSTVGSTVDSVARAAAIGSSAGTVTGAVSSARSRRRGWFVGASSFTSTRDERESTNAVNDL